MPSVVLRCIITLIADAKAARLFIPIKGIFLASSLKKPLPFTPEFGVRFPVSAVWKKQKKFLPHPRVKVNIVGSHRDREVACSASDRQGSNFESCVWRTVSSQSSHYPQEVLLAQLSLYVHKCGLKHNSFHFLPLQQVDKMETMSCCESVEIYTTK